MRSCLAVLLAAGLASGCTASPEPELPAAHADGTPATPPSPRSEHAQDELAGAAPPHGAMPDPHRGLPGNPHGAAARPADEVPVTKVERATGPGGRTVAEVHAQRKQLADQPVAVRGTVVKFLPGIMGRNWLHLRDGSGSAKAGDHDLTVTTSEQAAVGAVVVARGLLRADKDFGSGYAYGVIVEEAKLTTP